MPRRTSDLLIDKPTESIWVSHDLEQLVGQLFNDTTWDKLDQIKLSEPIISE